VPNLPPVPVTLPDGSPAPTTAGPNADGGAAAPAADPNQGAATAIAGVGAAGGALLDPPPANAADGTAAPGAAISGVTGGPARAALVSGESPAAQGSDLAERARSFAPPIGLLVAVVIFLVVQHRIDRRDPKLAGAPLDRLAASIGFE
jgi:hypothetical protein